MRSFETLSTREESGVLFASLNSPPMNLIGPSLVRDLLDLLIALEQNDGIHVVVFTSADDEFFIPHVDLTRVAEYSKEAARAGGLANGSLGGVFRRLSDARQVSIAQIEGFARGAGSEFALACDMRFASRERAVFAQVEAGFGASPGAGAIQHLTRLMGRGRAMEAILSASDYDADTAERYGWINRALPQAELGRFVHDLAVRIAAFPSAGLVAVKRRINDVALPPPEDVRDDAALFKETIGAARAQARTAELMRGGMQTRGDIERHFAVALGELTA